VTKAQAAIEAAAAGKVAAVAASAAAVAGGGYPTVERTARHEHRERAHKTARHDVVSPRRKVVVRLPAPAAAPPAVAAPARAKREPVPAAQAEFGAAGEPVSSGTRAAFEAASRSLRAHSAAATPSQPRPRAAAPRPTPELASENAGSEFGP
jgi:hypothetical protein